MVPDRYKIFLDDERDPPEVDWMMARSYEDGVRLVDELGLSDLMSVDFDHDLGSTNGIINRTGFDFAKFLVERDLDTSELSEDFSFMVHSANPVGAGNIQAFLHSYLQFRRGEREARTSQTGSSVS